MTMRAASGIVMTAISTQQRVVPTTGQTVSIAQTNASVISFIVDPVGTLLALSVALPAGAFDGQRIVVASTQAITGLTLTTTGTLLGALTAAVVNGFASYVWNAAQTTWYRIG